MVWNHCASTGTNMECFLAWVSKKKENNPQQLHLSVITFEIQDKVNAGCYEQAVTESSKPNLQAC